jgi:hypothetical protein
MTKYSEDLINRITKYYKDNYDHVIDRETAISYLDSLGGMFRVVAESTSAESLKKSK